MTQVRHNHLLDLDDGVGVVASMVRYYIRSDYQQNIGTIRLQRAPSIDLSSDSNVKRTLRGLMCETSDFRDINPYTDRLYPNWVLEDGTEWPMGEFLFRSAVESETDYANTTELTVVDGDWLLDDPLKQTYSIFPGGSVVRAMNELADQAGIMFRQIPDDSGQTIHDPAYWEAGTPRKRAMTELSHLAGWLPPYFDNRGWLVVRPKPVVDEHYEAEHRYGPTTGRVKRHSIRRATDFGMPNVHLVTNNGPTKGEIHAEAAVDPSLPWSREQRRREIVKHHAEQSIGSTEQAGQMARSYADADPGQVQTVRFVTGPDPRHDLFDVVNWDGLNMAEQRCGFSCEPGADMEHQLSRGFFNLEGDLSE